MAAFLLLFHLHITVLWQDGLFGWGDAGSVGGCGGWGGGRLGGGRGFGACARPALGRFLGAVTDGEWGWDICGQRTGALGDEGNERSSPCSYFPTWQSHLACLACHNPAEPMEFASDCDPSFSPRRRGFMSYPGFSGRWGEGAVFPPPGCLFSLMGPLILMVAPVAAKTRGLCSGELSGRRGCVGAGARFPAGRPLPPLLLWPYLGLVFSCSGETCQIFFTRILHGT